MPGNTYFGSKVKLFKVTICSFRYDGDMLGAFTVCFAIFAFFWLPRSSATWKLLSDREKTIAKARMLTDSSVTVNENLNIRDAFRPFMDPMYL